MFIVDLPFRFIRALIAFTFGGLIGWVGIILIGLRFFHIITWPWWVAGQPLEYGVLYCLYMTIDGALYRAGRKEIGRYAVATMSDEHLGRLEMERTVREWQKEEEQNSGGVKKTGEAIGEEGERSLT